MVRGVTVQSPCSGGRPFRAIQGHPGDVRSESLVTLGSFGTQLHGTAIDCIIKTPILGVLG